jgi:hypothetical protein
MLLLALPAAAAWAFAASSSTMEHINLNSPSCDFHEYVMINDTHLRVFVAELPERFNWDGRYSRRKPTARSAYTSTAPWRDPLAYPLKITMPGTPINSVLACGSTAS